MEIKVNKKAKFLFFSIFFFILLSSCGNDNRVFEKYHDFNESVWVRDSIVQFEFEIPDVEAGYNLFYNVRNTSIYPFHNLYIEYSITDSNDVVIAEKNNEMYLFDPKTGKPESVPVSKTEGSIGDIYDNTYVFMLNQAFPYAGKYTITMKHNMRIDPLPEMLAVGLRVDKYVEEKE